MVTFYMLSSRKSSLRLSSHDYSSAGFYFITITTRHRENFFGKIIDHNIILSDMGKVVAEQWYKLPEYFPDVTLDEFVVMPNHVHGIIVKKCLSREEINSMCFRNQSLENIQQPLSKIIRLYKANCTRIINAMQSEIYFSWQKNYYDHMVRNKNSLDSIRQYIQLNPSKWNEDEHNIYEKV